MSRDEIVESLNSLEQKSKDSSEFLELVWGFFTYEAISWNSVSLSKVPSDVQCIVLSWVSEDDGSVDMEVFYLDK